MVSLRILDEFDPTELVWWARAKSLVELSSAPPEGVYLSLDAGGLKLMDPAFPTPFQLQPDDVFQHAQPGSLLHRATGVGGASPVGLSVLDACAGFGIDGLALARAAQVTLIERQPLVFIMLLEFAARMGASVDIRHGDGLLAFEDEAAWDVIYLDPMFPQRSKKALPSRPMQHLRDLSAGAEHMVLDEVLTRAIASANDRVVLKRRLRDPVIDRPSYSLAGKTIRFDVYRKI